jgi:hypothetical protein
MITTPFYHFLEKTPIPSKEETRKTGTGAGKENVKE